MTGRYEHDRYLENLIKIGVQGYPEDIVRYSKESGGKQMTTKHNYTNTVKRFYLYMVMEKGKLSLTDITKRDIMDWFHYVSLKRDKDGNPIGGYNKWRTLHDYYVCLSNFFKYLIKFDRITSNPMPDEDDVGSIVPKAVEEREVVYLTPDEVAHVKKNIEDMRDFPLMDLTIFTLGVRFGLRAQALTEIDVEDIDFENGKLWVIEKGNFKRKIVLGPDTLNLLSEYLEYRDEGDNLKALFTVERYGRVRRISRSYIENMIKDVTSDLDKHITPHKMRSTCITNTYMQTHNIYATATQAGHHNLSNTMLYINTDDERQEVAVAMEGIL